MTEWQVSCFGISHHQARLELRERLRFTLLDVRAFMASNSGKNGAGDNCSFAAIREMVLLSTCNRVELYVTMDADAQAAKHTLSELVIETSRLARERAGLPPADDAELTRDIIEEATYHFAGEDAIRHLCRVAAGLDSMVLGETQILSQIRQAHEDAVASGLSGPVLDAVFHSAHRAGKKARSKTAISSNPSSVSSAAVALARQRIGQLRGKEAVVVGLGEIGQLALKLLATRRVGCLRIVNRTADRAMALAAHIKHTTGLDCYAHALEDLPDAVKTADVLITAAAAPSAFVDRDAIARGLDKGRKNELVIVDIGVPRNVAAAVSDLEGVHVFDMDDIDTVRDEAVAARKKEVPQVMAIIDREIEGLEQSLRRLRLKPLIDQLRQKAEAIRRHELERTYQKIDSPDPEVWSQFQRFSSALVNKLFHDPTMFLQEKAATGTADSYAATVRELFRLKKSEDES